MELASFFMLRHPLKNFELQKYYQNDPQLSSKNYININDFYSRNNLTKIKDGTYAINLDEYKSIGTHWISLYVKNDNVTYFDKFQIEHIPKEIKKIHGKQIYNNKHL